MISKELFKLLYPKCDDYDDYRFFKDEILTLEVIEDMELSIHEVAYKCKELAKSYGYDIWSGWDTDKYIAKVNPDFDDCQDYWCEADTEPDAIFAAMQWVIEKIEIK